jgi:hypothetical protein
MNPLKLMYITNEPEIAKIVEDCGVDWIFIDLEINGKVERQGHLDTVISHHHLDDVKKVKKLLTKAKLLVRVNPIYNGSEEEINRVINDGANIIMLPFFKTKEEVIRFVEYVNGRVKICLLCETPEAVANIDDILTVPGIDFIHIGLNDLHLGYKMKFMFELVTNGTVEMLCNKFKIKGIRYGFGGISKLGLGLVPAEFVIAEHYRLGSSMAILSRAFCNTKLENNLDVIKETFSKGVKKIRNYEKELMQKEISYFDLNKEVINQRVKQIISSK